MVVVVIRAPHDGSDDGGGFGSDDGVARMGLTDARDAC